MPTKMELAEFDFLDSREPGTMMVAVLDEPKKFSIRYAKIPEPGPGELRVKIKWVGICGSDLEAFRGSRDAEFISFPTRLGHEVAGTVDRVDEGVTNIRAGDRVTCRYVWGAYAEYIVCKPFNVKVVPPEVPMKDISLMEIFPSIVHTAELAEIDSGRDVLIMGQGVSGLLITQLIALYSPRALAVTDLKEKNLELAKRYGATHTYRIPSRETPTMEVVGKDFPEGFDVVIPCLLEGEGMIDAVDCAAMGGRIVMYGCIGKCRKTFDFFKVHRKRLEIYSTEPRRDIDMRNFFNRGLDLALDGLWNTGEIVTHTLPLERIQEAFEMKEENRPEVIHVLIDCEA
jgi:threonine dehydrogenase-like Zn-dependent dehydrogenase